MKLCTEPDVLPQRRCPEAPQLAALNCVLDAAWAGNLFYARKWRVGRREPRFDPGKADPERVRFVKYDRANRAVPRHR